MLNTNHWANILQPESNQVLLGISCPSIKVSFSPDFSAKKPRKLGNPRPIKKIEKPKKPPAIKPPKKMFTSAKIAQYLTEIYPCWVTTDHLLTLPFLEGKKRQTLLHMLTYMRVEAKKPLEVRLVSVMQPGCHRPYKEYRLKKQPDA